MLTRPWNPVDRKIGLGIALAGVALMLLNITAVVAQAQQLQLWWVLLAITVPGLQLLAIVGWAQLSPRLLRLNWLIQLAVLFAALFLVDAAIKPGGAHPIYPEIWVLDAMVLASAALVLRTWVSFVATVLLAATVPLSALVFLGEANGSTLSWGLVHASRIMWVMLVLVLRQQLIRLSTAQAMAAQFQAKDERTQAEAEAFDQFARLVHDEVLSTFGATMHFSGKPPLLLRQGAAAALQTLERERLGSSAQGAPTMELRARQAERLVLDLIAAAAPSIHMKSVAEAATVPAAAAGAVGLAAAEAARTAERHTGGGLGFLVVGEGGIRVSILDSGPGFELGAIEPVRFGIRESILGRIEELPGGRVTIDSGAAGTTVVIAWSRPAV